MPNKALIKSIIFLALILAASSVHAWVEPTTVPPGNNILAPLNSSAFGQSKVGGLILNLGNAAHGLIVRYGLVGIGTDNPQAALDVVGKVRSTGLEVNSTTEGALLPRMTTAERDAISSKVEGLLIYNTETKQLEVYADGAWKASSGGGDSLPKGTIAFFNLSACPSGWTEKTELKGRYPIGLPTSGTLGQSVGEALNNGEDRSAGRHSHSATQNAHSHSTYYEASSNATDIGSANSIRWIRLQFGWPSWLQTPVGEVGTTHTASWSTSGFAQPNVLVDNAGSVPGTNAPYLQLLSCEKQTEGSSGSGSSSSCTPCQVSKMTTAERDALSNPEMGLEIFNTDTKTKNLFNGAEWTEIVSIIPGLVGRWSMNETSGTTVTDSSGRGNHGTATGTTIVDGKIGKARSFNGSSDYIYNTSPVGMSIINSVSVWINPASISNKYIIELGSANNNWIEMNPGGTIRAGTNGSGTFCDSITVLKTSQWYNIVRTFDGAVNKLYINGNLECSNSTSGTTPTKITIGAEPNGTYVFNGLIDEVKIYSIALTPEQIKADYESTK